MPNPIRFSATHPSNSLRKGNASVWVRNKPIGPTSVSGFWSGINPPPGGFTIYQERTGSAYANFGPSIAIIKNDNELINYVKSYNISGINNRADALAWLSTQNSLLCIKQAYPSQITDNLIFNVESSVVESYPEKNNVWFNLASNDFNSSLLNGPVYQNISGGIITFDGTNDFVLTPNSIGSLLTGDLTFTVVAKRNGNSPSGIGGLIGNLWHTTFTGISMYLRNNNTQIDIQTANGSSRTSYSLTIPISNLNWVNYTLTNSGGVVSVYINGVLLDSRNRSIQQNSTRPVVLAKWAQSYNSYYLNGSISSALVYNRALSQTEVLRNYYLAPLRTEGLSMVVDPYNIVSNNTSTTITDLTSSKYIFNYEGTVTKSQDFGGSLRLNNGRIYRNVISWYGNYTFGFWVKMVGDAQSGMFYSESNRGPSGCARVYSPMNSNGTFTYQIWDNSSSATFGTGNRNVTTTTNVQNGDWHFITCIWSNGSSNRTRGLYVFVNGKLEASTDMIGNDGAYASFHLGGVTGCLGTTAFNCYLGPFMQYSNLAMSNDQVQDLYNSYQIRYK